MKQRSVNESMRRRRRERRRDSVRFARLVLLTAIPLVSFGLLFKPQLIGESNPGTAALSTPRASAALAQIPGHQPEGFGHRSLVPNRDSIEEGRQSTESPRTLRKHYSEPASLFDEPANDSNNVRQPSGEQKEQEELVPSIVEIKLDLSVRKSRHSLAELGVPEHARLRILRITDLPIGHTYDPPELVLYPRVPIRVRFSTQRESFIELKLVEGALGDGLYLTVTSKVVSYDGSKVSLTTFSQADMERKNKAAIGDLSLKHAWCTGRAQELRGWLESKTSKVLWDKKQAVFELKTLEQKIPSLEEDLEFLSKQARELIELHELVDALHQESSLRLDVILPR